MNKIYLFLLALFASVGFQANALGTCYISFKDGSNGSWTKSVQMEGSSSSIQSYTHTFPANSEFRYSEKNGDFTGDDTDYKNCAFGPADDNTNTDLSKTENLGNYQQGNYGKWASWKVNTAGTYLIEVNSTAQVRITKVGDGSSVIAAPTDLFVVGSIGGNNWDPQTAIQQTEKSTDGKIFLFKNISVDNSEFYFLDRKDTWANINSSGIRYSATPEGSNDNKNIPTLAKGTGITFAEYVKHDIGGTQFKISENGSVDVVVDFTNATVTYYNANSYKFPSSGEVTPVPSALNIFIAESGNGNSYAMQGNATDGFTYEVDKTTGSYIRFSTGTSTSDWTAGAGKYYYKPSGSENGTIQVTEDGQTAKVNTVKDGEGTKPYYLPEGHYIIKAYFQNETGSILYFTVTTVTEEVPSDNTLTAGTWYYWFDNGSDTPEWTPLTVQSNGSWLATVDTSKEKAERLFLQYGPTPYSPSAGVQNVTTFFRHDVLKSGNNKGYKFINTDSGIYDINIHRQNGDESADWCVTLSQKDQENLRDGAYFRGRFTQGEYINEYTTYDSNENQYTFSDISYDGVDSQWGDIVFFIVKNGVRYYFHPNADNATLQPNGDWYKFSGSDENHAVIPTSGFNTSKTYDFFFRPTANGGNGQVLVRTHDNVAHSTYYLSGDINCWSDIVNRNTEATDINRLGGYFVGEYDYIYQQDDAENPYMRFRSKDELNKKWKFTYMGVGPEGTDGSDWYVLDLGANGCTDMHNNVGRLCGTFKIVTADGLEENTGFGITADTSNDGNISKEEEEAYLNKLIKVRVQSDIQQGGGQNIQLYNTAVDNAAIWINPSTKKIFITGQAHDMYVYYVNPGYEKAKGPKVYMNAGSQRNSYTHMDHFREYNSDGNGVSAVSQGFYDFSWTHVNDESKPVTYYPYGPTGESQTYTNYWCKKIPSSLIHRAPMGYLVSVKPSTASDGDNVYFPRVRVNCEDVWFFENKINVFFRFADENVNNSKDTKVFFNAWLDQYDANGIITDQPLYLKNAWDNMEYIKSTDSNYTDLVEEPYRTEKVNGVTKNLNWYKAPGQIPTEFANGGHAMFATNYGGFYPTNGVSATVGDRASVALNGVNLYYVVGGNSSRVSLLYSHLKGTVAKGEANKIQINAEFFADGHNIYRDGDLNTHFGAEVDYQFSVINSQTGEECLIGATGTKDGSEVNIYDAENGYGWIDEPFVDWEPKDTDSGLFTVKVTVRYFNGTNYQTYSATDVYPIFDSRD